MFRIDQSTTCVEDYRNVDDKVLVQLNGVCQCRFIPIKVKKIFSIDFYYRNLECFDSFVIFSPTCSKVFKLFFDMKT